ncbi:MAG TPA: hypothetical protein VFO05_04780 [Candidatus Limnocylindrales bacterium]|nr:hypothetical protein [Candidatus Limnocylindrales bacterium]
MTSEPDPSAPAGNGSGSGATTLPPAPAGESRAAERGGIILGAILVVLGLLFLAQRVLDVDLGQYGWPLFVIVPGVLLFLFSFSAPPREGSGLAVAGAITTAVGVILAVQNVTDLWATWAYAWALVAPGAVGLGMAVYGFVRGMPDLVREGLRALGAGLGLFVAFGLFFEGVIGLSGEPLLLGSDYLPIVLIAGGGLLLLWGLLRGRRA